MYKIFFIVVIFVLSAAQECVALNVLDENAKFASDLNSISNEQFNENKKHILYYKGSSDFYLRGSSKYKKYVKPKYNKTGIKIRIKEDEKSIYNSQKNTSQDTSLNTNIKEVEHNSSAE